MGEIGVAGAGAKLTITVVVPFYNSARTLFPCLTAIQKLEPAPDLVLLLDDGSTDESSEIAGRFPFAILKHPANRGRGQAKNTALQRVETDLVLFVDSDVICSPRTISSVVKHFRRDPKIAGVSAVPSPLNSYSNFSSRYKAVYMHHILVRCAGKTDIVHGCLQAFRLRDLHDSGTGFSVILHCDDIDLGIRLTRAKKTLYLSKSLRPVHERHYSLRGLLWNDFRVASEFSRLLLHYRQVAGSLKKRRFAHASLSQITSIALSVTVVGLVLTQRSRLAGIAALWCLFASALLNYPLYRSCHRRFGSLFVVQAVCFTWIDQVVMAAGMICGPLARRPAAPLTGS